MNSDRRMVLEVGFEPGKPNAGLRFIEGLGDGYFDLEIIDGITIYDGRRYLVQEVIGGMTRLMINVENITSPINPRSLPGRTIDDANIPVEFEFSHHNPVASAQQQPLRPVPPITKEPSEPVQPIPPRPVPPVTQDTNEPIPPEPRLPPEPPGRQVYRIQVGAFHSRDNAQTTFNRLSDAGFFPVYEQRNDYFRVLVTEITPEDLFSAANRLFDAGFRDQWIRAGN